VCVCRETCVTRTMIPSLPFSICRPCYTSIPLPHNSSDSCISLCNLTVSHSQQSEQVLDMYVYIKEVHLIRYFTSIWFSSCKN
jgi:hypothetical protein